MSNQKKIDKLTLFLIPIGVAVNFVGGQIAILLRLPVYLDSIGTIVVGGLCGGIPGAIVGLISNVLNSISSPTTLFYAPLSIAFGLSAAFFSKRKVFLNFGKTLLSALWFAFVGGVCGACITMLVNGGDFGPITASLYAAAIQGVTGWGVFPCQLVSEFFMDLIDKAITIIVCFGVFKALPNRLLSKVKFGSVYAKEEKSEETEEE
ncbi:MAG: hypothetical protein HUJ69_00885 [Lachnospiraceae bacterium]|nr:hypothetical protein [Lachnospiraceae bacterium]